MNIVDQRGQQDAAGKQPANYYDNSYNTKIQDNQQTNKDASQRTTQTKQQLPSDTFDDNSALGSQSKLVLNSQHKSELHTGGVTLYNGS